ncbi:F0F1 ATP synthase subunit delta [Marinobacter koreensis]|uniref:ATP synthase subunit b n=1 Tax=Marinobacter koreensis TaxID=335974 RepID=A0ABW0RM37_9GAMM|nr:F0F1 ATP synthase subunit delta [Marinobacter koreensis]
MELNWSTFILEVINFLVLVWVLKRFFYRPVMQVIAQRRAEIEKTMTDARALEEKAEHLREQYEGRISAWREERQQARDALSRELETERARRLDALKQELGQAREKLRATEENRQAVATRAMESAALEQGARFATHLLEQAAGPELESRLIDLFTTQLSQLPPEKLESIHRQQANATPAVTVLSAYPLNEQTQEHLTDHLARISGSDKPPEFRVDPDLVAGIRVTLGAWTLAANVQDELKGFTEFHSDV